MNWIIIATFLAGGSPATDDFSREEILSQKLIYAIESACKADLPKVADELLAGYEIFDKIQDEIARVFGPGFEKVELPMPLLECRPLN